MSGGFLATLASRRSVAERVMIVAAHPDDETLMIGAQLCRFRDALLVHVTDGAPRDGADAAAHGFAAAADYVAARRAELAAALAAGEARGVRTREIGLADQDAFRNLTALTRSLCELIRAERPTAIVTHAYEGGHPDHDAAAFAVSTAERLLAAAGEGLPELIEASLYRAAGEPEGMISRLLRSVHTAAHRSDGDGVATGVFLPGPNPVTELVLTPDERARKQRMVSCFVSQAAVLGGFDLAVERLRAVSTYDFARPPHPGTLHYERLGWGITGEAWCREAAAALAALGLPAVAAARI